MKLIIIFFVGFFVQTNTSLAQLIKFYGEPAPISVCITEKEYFQIETKIQLVQPIQFDKLIDAVLFHDPVGDGGINSFAKPINNYVDLDPGPGILDYMGGNVTYNGHRGTDIDILDFYDMDEGIPVLAAAAGEVIFVHDGEYLGIGGFGANNHVFAAGGSVHPGR